MAERIIAVVRGHVMFPDDPDHEGHNGLIGGEDAIAERRKNQSADYAMTWCRDVLDGRVIRPTRVAFSGPIPKGVLKKDIIWTEAEVWVEDDTEGTLRTWITNGRHWHRAQADGSLGDWHRTDGEQEG